MPALVAPELARRKEPLEAFPLDAMAMVGSLDKEGSRWRWCGSTTCCTRFAPGNYLGQNYGRITKITETEVDLARNRAGRRWRMDRTRRHIAAAREVKMNKQSQNNRRAYRALCAASGVPVARPLLPLCRAMRRTAIEAVTGSIRAAPRSSAST